MSSLSRLRHKEGDETQQRLAPQAQPEARWVMAQPQTAQPAMVSANDSRSVTRMGKTNEQYELAPGLAEVLEVLCATKLDDHVTQWKAEIAEGEIGKETREVLVDLGWITYSDSRVKHLTPTPRRAKASVPDPAKLADDEAAPATEGSSDADPRSARADAATD